MRGPVVLVTLFFLALSGSSRSETLCSDLELYGTQGTHKTAQDVVGKHTLFVVIDETTAEQWPALWFLKDLETASLGVVFIFRHGEKSSRVKSQRSEIPFEVFTDSHKCFGGVAEFPRFRLYDPGGKLLEDSGEIPPTERLLKLALPSNQENKPLFTILGKEGVLFQNHENDCAPAALTMLVQRMGIPLSQSLIFDRLDKGQGGEPVSLLEIKRFLTEQGFTSDGWQGSFADLQRLEHPVLLHLDDRHFVVMTKAPADGVVVLDPKLGRSFMTIEHLAKRWKGVYFSVNPI